MKEATRSNIGHTRAAPKDRNLGYASGDKWIWISDVIGACGGQSTSCTSASMTTEMPKTEQAGGGVLQNGGRERGKMDRGCSLRGRGEEASELNRRGVGRWLEGKSKRPARG